MKKKRLLIICIIFCLFITFLYAQNNMICVTSLSQEFSSLPSSFDGYKIVHLSDLHCKLFGKEQIRLVKKIKKIKPDIIVFTGDLVDSKKYKIENSISLMKNINKIAPVYYVTGNHEFWSGRFGDLELQLEEIGVKVLRNEKQFIERSGEKIIIAGIDDPSEAGYNEKQIIDQEISISLRGVNDKYFKILLSHRPEVFETYVQNNINLVFSGHAHGGQVILPFIGGTVSPNQGWFPKYFSGIYEKESTTMIVSRGLGNSIIPQRIFNRPEIVVLTMKTVKND